MKNALTFFWKNSLIEKLGKFFPFARRAAKMA